MDSRQYRAKLNYTYCIILKVYRLVHIERTTEDELRLEAVEPHFYVEDIVSTIMKIIDFTHN